MSKSRYVWVALIAAATHSQAQIFDAPQNLKVLPEDIPAAELRDVMRGFAFATGSRCHTCHEGEPGQPLSTFDFASDEKEKKRTARAMLRMVSDLNALLARELGKDADEIVRVECVTCHRGQARPVQLADELEQTFDAAGSVAATARYRELKDQYYGSHTFDFSEWSVLAFAERLARNDETTAALTFLSLNIETNPKSVASLIMQAQLYAKSGDTDAAKASLERALEIEPDNAFVGKQLQSLDQ